MLIRVKFNGEQKYIKIIDLTLENLLIGAFLKFEAHLLVYQRHSCMMGLELKLMESSLMSPASASAVMGGSDRESDDTIILSEDGSPSRKPQRSDDEAKNLIEGILKKKPGGEVVIKEYSKTNGLTDCTRRKMINILVLEMTDSRTSPSRSVRETFPQGIVSLFPYLKDPYTTN